MNLATPLARELSRLTGRSVNAKIRVFDNEKKLVVDKIIAMDSLPGTHAFLGVMMPNSRIGSIEIEYQGQPTFEVIGDITVFDGQLSKIAGVPFDEDEQHCDSPLSTDRVISSIPGPLPMFPPLNQELIPVVPTVNTANPPSGSQILEGNSENGLAQSGSGTSNNSNDQAPASPSCTSFQGGNASGEGILIGLGLISIFGYMKRRKWFSR